LYTVNAAYASGDDAQKGTIEEGKLADFTVLSRDLHGVPASMFSQIRVDLTIVGGRIIG
jgi:hypothetical protein